MSSNLLKRVRVELFFKTKSELRDRVKFLSDNGVSAFNLVNKDKNDAMEDWCAVIAEQYPNASVSAHWSVKYNKVADRRKKGGDDATYDRFSSFVNSISADEVLLISGSGEKRPMNSVEALKRLQQDRCVQPPSNDAAKICVAYNPFFPTEYDRDVENDRLLEKLESGEVSKIYFQFGTDIQLLQAGLDFICKLREELGIQLDVCGSVFLPTKKLIAQQKFRPWNGVFLSDGFLSGEAGARKVVLDVIRMYRRYDAELLFEAPGIRTDKDFTVLTGLLQESSGATNASDTNTKKEPAPSRSRRRGSSETPISEPPRKSKKPRESNAKEANSKDPKPSTDDRKLHPSTCVDTSLLPTPCIVLFGSHDVRLHDNRCVEYGSFHSTVVPVFLWSEQEQEQWGVRGAMEVILKDALTSLDERLKDNGMQLICRDTKDSTKELLELCKETGASVVYCNIEHTPEDRERLERRSEILSEHGIHLVRCNSSLLYNPAELNLGTGFNGGHFATLMPFLKACKKQFGHPIKSLTRGQSSSLVANLKGPRNWPAGCKIGDLPLATITGHERWDKPILDRFPMNENSAKILLDQFMVGGLTRYESQRSRADLEGSTSQLSAHLRVGTLSPYELYWATEGSNLSHDEKKTFSRRLFWRDLAYFQLLYFPFMRQKSIRQHYEDTQWADEKEGNKRFEAWKRGRTGYPLVDAGMRELWATGWMTQSVRMVCASFLVEYLRVNWTRGAEWFHYTLADADSAINPMMWQNAGRSVSQ
jgi:deoxyribodipyrimidine photolyase